MVLANPLGSLLAAGAHLGDGSTAAPGSRRRRRAKQHTRKKK